MSLSSGRSVTGYNSSASLYGGDLAADNELESYFKNAGKKGSNKKKNKQQQQNLQQQSQQQGNKKQHKAHTPAGYQNLGYGLIDESTSLVFTQKLVVGTCTDLERDYLRLTTQADPSRVRSAATLARALTMVKRKWIDTHDYEYACNQLKSIRQDCTVQHLRDQLTVEVYETHARIALECLDLQEFAVVQTQLQLLYKEGVTCGLARECEFAAYKVLYSCLMTGPSDSGLVAFINDMRSEVSAHDAVQHALAVRAAMLTTNFARFFSLWTNAPNMSAYLMDPLADSMRVRSTRILISAYRPTISMAHLTRALAFDRMEEDESAAAASASSSAAAAASSSPALAAAPTQSQMRACKEYLDSKFEGMIVYVREPAPAGSNGGTRIVVDCKASHANLEPTNAAHRLPINSARATHTVSASAAAAASASPKLAPTAPTHDVAMWCRKDAGANTGRVRLGSDSATFSGNGGGGQPSRGSISFSPSFAPSPSPPPPSASAPPLDDAVSRKRRNSQPLSSMSHAELTEAVAEAEAQLLDPNVRKEHDDFTMQLMLSRLKALQKALKKSKKPK